MNKDAAERVVSAMMLVFEALGTVDSVISEVESEEERSRLIRALGAIMRITREELLVPIFSEHPELVPARLDMKRES